MDQSNAALRRAVIEKDFCKMNQRQRQAVTCTEGPLLILAGAGSGKTTVLVNRAALLVRYGSACDAPAPDYTPEQAALLRQAAAGLHPIDQQVIDLCAYHPCPPYRILTITFTNKAAGELKDRLERMLGPDGREIVACTFHSFCAKMLRTDGEALGFSRRFTIYDTDDAVRLMKDCIKQLGYEDKSLTAKAVLGEIGRAKDKLIGPKEFADAAGADFRLRRVAALYELYQNKLRQADAMDFDDLLVGAVTLLQQFPAVREKYQRRFRYLMVDEYQDTNHAQYCLITLLAAACGNLCVVGDDDQSIYKFRGATIENILHFEDEFAGCRVIRLEQNYRSTKTILDAANAVIAKNTARKAKTLWTENEQGDAISAVTLENEQEEARYVTDTVMQQVGSGRRFSDFAVLYRMNAQANAIEHALVRSGIPYRIIGGHRFNDTQEVRDVTAYLRVVNNPADTVSLQRIVNVPKRGIGTATLEAAAEIAAGLGITLYEVLQNAADYPATARAAGRIAPFIALMEDLRAMSEDPDISVHALYQQMLERSGYLQMWQAAGEAEQTRVENLGEFASSILQYEQACEDGLPSLAGFLEENALMTDVDNYDADADAMVLMTMHAAKGLEFPVVFLPGFEDGIFPGMQSLFDREQLEEDRRLCYVAITRAKKQLHITHAQSRMLFGNTAHNRASQFLDDIPKELLKLRDKSRRRDMWQQGDHSVGYFSSPVYDDYQQPQPAAKKPAAFGRPNINIYYGQAEKPAPKKAAEPAFAVGDTVEHGVFGVGVIQSAKPMGGDTLLVIRLRNGTEKKVMANYAKLKKV